MHIGGGLTLLQALYSARNFNVDWEQLDIRVRDRLPLTQVKRYYVMPSIISRLTAEWRLWRRVTKDDVVLCFHGLVPLLPLKGEVTVYLQNRILLSRSSLSGYPLKTKVRLWGERCLVRLLAGRIKKFIVQTPSMAEQAKAFLGEGTPVVICPFVIPSQEAPEVREKDFDFVYVASSDSHKNHHNLLLAWCLLAQQSLWPSLALTIPYDSALAIQIEDLKERWNLKIVNLGQIIPMQVRSLYSASGALIYPSTNESLGLPLIEASQQGLPVLASELDYVRDVVVPVETFDPLSHVSIARAVKRYLGIADIPQAMFDAETFLKEVLL